MKNYKFLFLTYFILTLMSSCFVNFNNSFNQHQSSQDSINLLNVEYNNSEKITPTSINLDGTAAENGKKQGLLLKSAIKNNLNIFWELVATSGHTRAEVMSIVKQRELFQILDRPDMFIEIRAMAEAAEVLYDDLLAFNLYSEIDYEKNKDHGCTAWIAHGTASKNGNTLFHKNRDLDRETQVVVNVAPSGGSNGYRALVSAGETGVSIGINDKGLALGNTYIDTLDIAALGIGSLTLHKELLMECDNIDEVFDYLDDVLDSGMNQGSNLFVINATAAAIIEHSGRTRCTKEEAWIVNGIGYRSNYLVVRNDLNTDYYGTTDPYPDSRVTRYEDARDFLEVRKGSLTPLDFNELSRYHRMLDEELPSEHDGVDGSISNYHTLCGATFEIDKDYPGNLSIMWTAIGTPDTAIYTPIHIGSTLINCRFNNSDAWDTAQAILEKQDDIKDFPFGSLLPYYLELESKMMEEREYVRDVAYNYLENSQPNEALAVITKFDNDSGNNVYNLMSHINNYYFWQDSFKYMNGIENSEDLQWNPANNSITLEEIVDSGRIITYDFNSITQSNLYFNLFEDDIDRYPYLFDSDNRNSHLEASDTDYESVWSSDDVRWQTTDPSDSDEAFIWIEMKIDEDPSEIEEIQFVFEGYSAESSDEEQAEFKMYLLRDGGDWQNDSCWHRLGSRLEILSGTDQIMTRSLTSSFEDFIASDGTLIWMVGTPYGHSDEIFCDYLKIDVIKKSTEDREYKSSGVLQSIQIDYGTDLDQYIFSVNHTIPLQTNITYAIQNAAGTDLYNISAKEAEEGFVLANLGTYVIRLYANLSTSNLSLTPKLNCWTINWSSNPPPSKIWGLKEDFSSHNNISLSWDAINDGDLSHYNIYRNGSKVGECSTNQYKDTGLSQLTYYEYKVSGVDTSDKEGLLSNPIIIKTGKKEFNFQKFSITPDPPYHKDEVEICVNITDYDGGDVTEAILSYNNGTGWENISMIYNMGSELYDATLPGMMEGTSVDYIIYAKDDLDIWGYSEPRSYIVINKHAPNITQIEWNPISPYDDQTVLVKANITDISGISKAILSYNASSPWTNVTMTYSTLLNLYNASIPRIVAGITVYWKIHGQDNGGRWNTSDIFSYFVSKAAPPKITNITWTPESPLNGTRVLVSAIVSDPDGISKVILEYTNTSIKSSRGISASGITNISMIYNSTTKKYHGYIPGFRLDTRVKIVIHASDISGRWNHSKPKYYFIESIVNEDDDGSDDNNTDNQQSLLDDTTTQILIIASIAAIAGVTGTFLIKRMKNKKRSFDSLIENVKKNENLTSSEDPGEIDIYNKENNDGFDFDSKI